jgi:hypothetical protein
VAFLAAGAPVVDAGGVGGVNTYRTGGSLLLQNANGAPHRWRAGRRNRGRDGHTRTLELIASS